MAEFVRVLMRLVTINAIGMLTTSPATTDPSTVCMLVMSLTNTTIIKTPISTVDAIEKMALNSGMFMVSPHCFYG